MSKIHISHSSQEAESPELSSQAIKLMHRFSAQEVRAKMESTLGKSGLH